MLNIRTFLRSLLLPCPGCREYDLPPSEYLFCPECRKKLHLFPENAPFCPGCGAPMDGALAVCSQCLAEAVRPWQEAVSVFPYSGYGKEIIRQLKFSNRPDLARPLAELAARAVKERGVVPDVLVPVPLHFTRLWSRSYNQAELLAKMVGRILQIPVAPVLKRRYTRTKQAKLKRRERHHLQDVFYCIHPRLLDGRKVMLVDDVITTGATLAAAAEALKNCHITGLSILTVARTTAYSKIKR